MNNPLKLFITGDPGCGKTTLVRKVVERLGPSVPMSGFYTEEVRVEGQRRGFRGVDTGDRVVIELLLRLFVGHGWLIGSSRRFPEGNALQR